MALHDLQCDGGAHVPGNLQHASRTVQGPLRPHTCVGMCRPGAQDP